MGESKGFCGISGKFSKIVKRIATERNNGIKLLVILIDLALVVSSYIITFLARFSGSPPEQNTAPFYTALPFMALSFLIYADIFGLLKFYRKSRRQILASIVKLVIMQALTTTSIAYFTQGFSFPRSVLLIAPAVQIALLTAWNVFMLTLRDRFSGVTDALIVGGARNVKTVTDKLSNMASVGRINVKYIFAPEEKEKYMDLIDKSAIGEVFLCDGLSEDLKIEILLLCMNRGKVVYLVPEVFEIALLHAGVIHFDDTPLILLDRLSLSFEQRLFKRIFDVTATLIALPLLLPFLLAVAAGVKLTSPGKAFYSQERVTAGGRIYRIYKFRTMREDAELLTGPVLSPENDERVTPFGAFLRRYHIDELPQLINVIKGEMSLVGPRSERPFFVERFSRDIEGYAIRSNVKAGLTGYAQIFGGYGAEAELKLKYDILYIRDYSLLLDIKLIFQTFRSIIYKRR